MELTNTDAFPSNPSIKIGLDSPLYGYYNDILNQWVLLDSFLYNEASR